MKFTKDSLWTGVKIAKISLLSAGLSKIYRPWGSRYLIRSLGEMPGLPAKAVQLFATKLELGGDYNIKQSPEAMSLQDVLVILRADTPHLVENIDEIEPAFATASLGQVHRVRLKEGNVLAVKVLFPGIGGELKKQIKFLLGAGRFGPAGGYGLDFAAYERYFSDKFSQEVNYVQEALNQSLFSHCYSELLTTLVIPKVYPQFSSARVLSQDFEPALRFAEIRELTEVQRFSCSQQLVKFLLLSIFKKGLVHCDLHRANWGYRPEQLVLYDFGSTIQLSSNQIAAFHELIRATDSMDNKRCLSALGLLGFDTVKLAKIQVRLAELCKRILFPLFSSEESKHKKMGSEIDDLLGADKWYFRVSGEPWFLLLMRTVTFIFNGIEDLRVRVNVREMLEDILQSPLVSIGQFESDAGLSKNAATRLFVSVSEKGAELVFLEMPSAAIDILETLIPEDTCARLKDLGYDLEDIKIRVQQSHYLPQTVFEATDPKQGRHYKVWISGSL